MSSDIEVRALRAEYLTYTLGIGTATPRLSWQLAGTVDEQAAYEFAIRRGGDERTTGFVDSRESLLVDWPDVPLVSREQATLAVRVRTESSDVSPWSEPIHVEAGLLRREDWRAPFVSPSPQAPSTGPRQAFLLRAEFMGPTSCARARVYATSHGVYELELNGRRVSNDLLSPGWTSYRHRLRYQTYDVTESLRSGSNTIGAWLADGWYRGRLGFNGGVWDVYGHDVALLLQLEVTNVDGRITRVPLENAWRWADAPVTSVGLYEGESFDARLLDDAWSTSEFDASSWQEPELLPLERFPARLEAPIGPPVRVTEVLNPHTTEHLANGRVRFDFGQNISGRLRLRVSAAAGDEITLHHAEMLERGELAIRPLRTATSVDRYTASGDGVEEWAPRFTYHGFRYAEVESVAASPATVDVAAEVLHSDMERIGWFECSHELLNRFHENVVWGMRDNFVDLPTDCPQRDERLGWTGDIQVFAPTAAFLYRCTGTLVGWLRDLAAEQQTTGSVPNFVPWVECGFPSSPSAAWGDAAVIVPWVLYQRTGDLRIVRDQFASMTAWVDQVDRLTGGTGWWNDGFHLGDWLDPTAPPDRPGDAHTDRYLVATAYHAHTAKLTARAADLLGETGHTVRFQRIHDAAKSAFNREYVTPPGLLTSDTSTAYALALTMDLLDCGEQRLIAGARLRALVEAAGHRIQTGFVGTPLICDALVQAGAADTAYRLLLQSQCPSWLYPVTMGATTVWERWDSMLPNGDVNESEMTSFNHYAPGAVVDFLHRVVAGLAPSAPGYKRMLVRPIPGGGLTYASARHITPYGPAAVTWHRIERRLETTIQVPCGVTADVQLPGQQPLEVKTGTHLFVSECRHIDEEAAA